MKYVYHKKGFTLVELVIVIAIMGIVFTAASSFLISNIKTFHRADDQIEAQHDAQTAINDIVDNIMEAGAIEEINFYGVTKSVQYVIFRIDINDATTYVKYEFDKNSNTISRGQGTDFSSITTNEYANNIKDFQIERIEEAGITYGVEIIIITELNDSEITLKNQVHFRNVKN